MKLSTKIILPIILISALLILLAGCFGVPTDESPAYTGKGSITGIIAAPCCFTSAEPVSENSGSPEFWCFYCQKDWNLQDGIEVVLTYGEKEVDTTTTNELGEYTFTNVDPGKNYVITAYCPDYDDDRPLVKDVALELVEGGSFDTKITDLVSTSLGLVVDFLVAYTYLGPEDIILEGVIADKPNFPKFPKFKRLVHELSRVLEEDCGDVNIDPYLQDALCKASEEVGRETVPDLVIGCSPGYTPPPPIVTYVLTVAADPTAGGTVTGEGTYNSGTTANISATAKPDYQFTGWTGDTVAVPSSSSTTILMNSNKAVTANFRLIPTYTVTYDGNGNTGGTAPVDASSPYVQGATVTVLGQGTLVRTGYTFDGDGSGTNRAAGDTFSMGTANVTLYAQWDINDYTVTFDKNGGDTEADPTTKTTAYGGNVGTLMVAM